MKIGIFGINTGPLAVPGTAAKVARAAEAAGFESVWTGEHVVLPDPQAPPSPAPPRHPMLDPAVALAFLAAHTERMRLATGIVILPQRNPVVLAKELASVDVVSRGRLIFGLGAGYLKPEFDAVGARFDDRGARTDEYIDVLRALWTEERPSFAGRTLRFAGADTSMEGQDASLRLVGRGKWQFDLIGYVQARNFSFIDGPVLARLKEGRSVRIDLDMAVLTKPDGPIVKQVMQAFTLSFDLWEERFAVSRIGSSPRSVSHLRARDAETWCLENVTMPVSSLGIGRDTPFWIRLAYRVQDVAGAGSAGPGERYTLQGLIDRLSRRREADNLARSIDAGPFRLP